MSLTGENHTETMAFLRDLEDGIERSAPSGIGQGSIGYGAGGPVWLDDFRSKRPPTPSELVNAYKSVAFACISLNANAVSRVPLRLYCRTAKGDKTARFWPTRPIEGREKKALTERLGANLLTRGLANDGDGIEEMLQHPLLDTLETPNQYMDGNMLIQHLARQLDAIGTAYWFPERPGPEWAPSEIWPLHSQYCYPLKGTGKTVIQDYVYFADHFQFDELVRFMNVSLRDPYLSGFAPLHACFEQVGLIGYYTAVVEDMLRSGARPEAMIGPKDGAQPWTTTERKRVEAMVNNRYGRGNQGKVWTVDGSFDMKVMTYAPADMASLLVSKDARLVAANCFDVPISMLENESSNKATAAEGSTQHQRNAVTPRCTIIASALTHQLARRVDPRLFFAFDEPVQRDRKTDAQIHDIYLKGKVITPNEVRADLGKDPREGGDEVLEDKPEGEGKKGKPGEKPERDEAND